MSEEISNEKKAVILTLHLIGTRSLPDWVDPLTYEMAKIVFDNHRGKFEDELSAVKEVIDERYQDDETF